MKARTAKKILTKLLYFKGFVSNYQPYSINQQKKALKVSARNYSIYTKVPMYDYIPVKKVPKKYRKSLGFIPDEFHF